jgi:hypothetical protein
MPTRVAMLIIVCAQGLSAAPRPPTPLANSDRQSHAHTIRTCPPPLHPEVSVATHGCRPPGINAVELGHWEAECAAAQVVPATSAATHQQNRKALVLWFGLVVLVVKDMSVQMQIYDRRYIMSHLLFEAKWSSGSLVILSVWSGLVGSGLALVWSCGKTNQSLLLFLILPSPRSRICQV